MELFREAWRVLYLLQRTAQVSVQGDTGFVVGSFGEDLPVYVAQDASDRTWFEVGGIAGTRLGGKIRLTDGEGKPVVSISRSETTFGHEYKGLAPDGRSAAFRPIFLVPPIERCRRRNAPDTRATCDTMDHSASTGSPLPLLHIVAVDHFRSAVLPKRNARRSALVGVQCPWYADAVPFLVVCRARIASRTPRTGSGTTRRVVQLMDSVMAIPPALGTGHLRPLF